MAGAQGVSSYVLDAADESDARRQVASAGLAFISIARERTPEHWRPTLRGCSL